MTLTRRELTGGAVALGLGGQLAPRDAAATPTGAAPIPVLATFSVLQDLTREVGGARVRVEALIGPDQDAHHHDARPGDLRRVRAARLVVRNGLGFEGWLDRLVAASGHRGPVLTASTGTPPIIVGRGVPDPHVWQSFANVKIMAGNIAGALSRLSPADRALFAGNLARFSARVDAAAVAAKRRMAAIPPARRVIVVPHNSFRHLAAELGFQVRALRALSTGAQPSATALATLVREVRATRAAAFFVENVGDARLIAQIARETGARVGGRLYSDALSGPDGPAPTTLAMLEHNARVIAAALTA
jgi:zinc/manganese transport system substrate-binding protein